MQRAFQLIFGIGVLVCVSCSPQKYILNKTEKLVEKIHTKEKVDTIFSYSSDNLILLWFYKESGIQSYIIKPYRIKKYPIAKAENIKVKKEDIKYYFDASEYKNVECFPTLLFDGESLEIYVKDKAKLHSFFDMKCLFNKKYDVNSLPYKIQYDFSKIFRPEGYSFEEMYEEE